jgi:hypothetical protein
MIRVIPKKIKQRMGSVFLSIGMGGMINYGRLKKRPSLSDMKSFKDGLDTMDRTNLIFFLALIQFDQLIFEGLCISPIPFGGNFSVWINEIQHIRQIPVDKTKNDKMNL